MQEPTQSKGGDNIATKEARNRATIKYQSKVYKRFAVRLRKDTESDMIKFLESKEAINKYLKDLIRQDMNK